MLQHCLQSVVLEHVARCNDDYGVSESSNKIGSNSDNRANGVGRLDDISAGRPKWSCPTCTLENIGAADYCGVCEHFHFEGLKTFVAAVLLYLNDKGATSVPQWIKCRNPICGKMRVVQVPFSDQGRKPDVATRTSDRKPTLVYGCATPRTDISSPELAAMNAFELFALDLNRRLCFILLDDHHHRDTRRKVNDLKEAIKRYAIKVHLSRPLPKRKSNTLDFDSMKVKESKDLLRSHGLKVTGTKKELIRRCWDSDDLQVIAPLKVKELQCRLKSRGLKISGTKSELRTRMMKAISETEISEPPKKKRKKNPVTIDLT